MVEITFEFNTNDVPRLLLTGTTFDQLVNCIKANPRYHNRSFSNELIYGSIKEVTVEKISWNQIIQEKTHYLYAYIFPHHLGTGEYTSKDPALRQKIRDRGKLDDDCGHIVSRNLGGKMLECNLFPQEKNVNRGWMGQGRFWKILVESLMTFWLKIIPSDRNPRVVFKIIWSYSDSVYPHRPNSGTYFVKLICDERKEEKDTNNEFESKCSILIGQLMNEIVKANVQEADYCVRLNWEEYTREMNSVKRYRRFLELLFKNIEQEKEKKKEEKEKAIHGHTTKLNPFSQKTTFIDFVPVMGSIKNIANGLENLTDGNVGKGLTNLVLGGGGLVLDYFTLGSASLVTKEASKVLAKIVAKEAAKKSAEQIVIKSVALNPAVISANVNIFTRFFSQGIFKMFQSGY
jgi:hypothetical protein